ncbi:MAG TPA: hypothetical protein DCE61_01610 [Cellvibrionales bacterium]|nr:hypothetical protein [Cellvibrionales bacterium]
MKPFYNSTFKEDMIATCAFIDEFLGALGLESADIDLNKIASILKGMRHDFPCNGGVENASMFKRVANFMSYFCAETPIVTSMPAGYGDLSNYKLNPIVAVAIGFNSLVGSTIYKGEGPCIIKSLRISTHSYFDFLDLLGSGLSPHSHIHWVSLFLEQLVYKSNEGIEYSDFVYDDKYWSDVSLSRA